MADLKISQLPDVQGTPDAQSQIIINENNAGTFTTKKISIGDLGTVGGAVDIYTPMKIEMTDGPNQSGSSMATINVGGWQERGPISVKDSAIQTASMPDGATHALIIYTSYNSWRPNYPEEPYNTAPMQHRRQYVSHRLYCTGGTFINGASWGGAQCNFTHTVPHKESLPQQPNNDYYSSMNKTKTKIVALDSPGQDLDFKVNVTLIMGGQNKMTSYMGDILVLPMKVSPTTAGFLSVMGAAFTSAEDDDLPSYTVSEEVAQASAAKTLGNEYRSYGKYLIDIIIDYIESYDDVNDTDIPSQLRDDLKLIDKRIHSVLFSSLKINADGSRTPLPTADLVKAELDSCSQDMNTLIATPFDFEIAAGVKPTDISF